jgi:hypothetical protein
VKPNRKFDAAVRKSRENGCHDKSSSNYKPVASGGRAAG